MSFIKQRTKYFLDFFPVRKRASSEGVRVRVESRKSESLHLQIRTKQGAQVQDQGNLQHFHKKTN